LRRNQDQLLLRGQQVPRLLHQEEELNRFCRLTEERAAGDLARRYSLSAAIGYG